MKRTKVIILCLSYIFTSCLYAAVDVIEEDGNKNTFNEIDDGYQAQKGWSFYQDYKKIDSNDSKSAVKKIEFNLLQKILDENRKQTKIQKKILALLQKQIDPKPKTITVNGKKCVANSSAQCFDYGSLITAEAKKVPVLVKFLKDPYDITKAAKYLQWQAKYFKQSINVGNSLQFAYSQFGEKAYPIGAQSAQYTVGSGNYEAQMLPDMQKKLILSMKNKISYLIFIGKNVVMDIYSALSTVDIIKQYGEVNIKLVFWDEKSEKTFIGAISSVYKMDMLKNWKNTEKIVSQKMFKEYGVTTTPSYVIKLNNKGKKESLIILHGKIDMSSFRTRTIAYFELRKLIDYSKFTEQNAWKESIEGKKVVDKMYKDIHGVKVMIPKEETQK